MDARSAILARAREALARSQRGPARPIPRDYIRVGEHAPGSEPVVADMVDKLEDYDAVVRTESDDTGIAEAIDELLGGAGRVAARSGRELIEDSPQQPIATLDLDHVDAVVTCSRVGISLSGTIVLDGEPDQGRRAITLVPDRHVCILEREAIMPTVPQAVDVLGEHPTRPMTWIAGPSATADIELVRVQGVHGPRNLGVVIAH